MIIQSSPLYLPEVRIVLDGLIERLCKKITSQQFALQKLSEASCRDPIPDEAENNASSGITQLRQAKLTMVTVVGAEACCRLVWEVERVLCADNLLWGAFA